MALSMTGLPMLEETLKKYPNIKIYRTQSAVLA